MKASFYSSSYQSVVFSVHFSLIVRVSYHHFNFRELSCVKTKFHKCMEYCDSQPCQ